MCIRDRNYNDVQDLGIPLTGTKVSLYRVIDNVREEQPIATAVVEMCIRDRW